MHNAFRLLARTALYAAFALLVGYFASRPVYRFGDPAMASIKLSVSLATQRVEPCVPLTPEQIAELAANMRRTESCGRERVPLIVEMDLDGRPLVRARAEPAGLWRDGPAAVYRRLETGAGRHAVEVRIRDSARETGWDHVRTETVRLLPARYFSVTFRSETGEIVFR